jgi:GDP-4-dehydro-6-deoxy-D-mannose reductase
MAASSARVLVTGGTGFVGQHLTAWLVDQGCRISVASIPGDPLLARLPEGVLGVAFDIRDEEAVGDQLTELQPDVIFHLAALFRGNDLSAMLSVNAVGTDTLLRSARSQPVPPVVVIPGSAAEYGAPTAREAFVEDSPLRPISSYGIGKVAQTLTGLGYARRGEVPVIIGRIFNMSGPGEPSSMLCGAIASQIAGFEASGESGVLRVGNLSPYRDYLDIRDVVRALGVLWQEGIAGEIYNISSGTARQVQQVVHKLATFSRVPVSIEPDPARQRPSDVPFCCGDATKLRTQTSWAPQYTLDETLAATLDYWRRQSLAKELVKEP